MIRKTKRWLIVISSLILIMLILAAWCRTIFPNAGLAHTFTVDQINQKEVVVDYAYGCNGDAQELLADLKKNKETYLEKMEESPIIILAEATGNIIQNNESIGQEVQVKKVLRGGNLIEADLQCVVFSYFGFSVENEVIHYAEPQNIMYPNQSYLLFLTASELNSYHSEPAFAVDEVLFPYINTAGSDTPVLTDTLDQVTFSQLSAYSFFCTSKELTAMYNQLQKEILENYDIAVSGFLL